MGNATAGRTGDGPQEVGTYAALEIGTLRLAVNTRHVVQAIPWPLQLTPLPRSKGALEGVFSHRGQVVPLINLQRWLSHDVASTRVSGQVLVLRDGGKVMGLAIDAVRGLLRVAASDIHRIHQDNDADEFFHSVALVQGTSSPVSLLDPVRLADRAKVWAADLSALPQDRDSEFGMPGGASSAVMQTTTRSFAVMRTGQTSIAFDADHVGEVVTMPAIQRMVGAGGQFLGMTVWRGRDVPVIETHQSIGLPATPGAPASPLLVMLCDAGRCVGVPVHEILSVRSFAASDIQLAVAVPPGHADLHKGTVTLADGGRVFVLDAQALIQSCPMSALSQTGRESGAGTALANQAASAGAHVVFRARQMLAAPLSQMQEIIRFPAEIQAVQDADSGVIGTAEWRGRALPLLDLALGSQQTPIAPDKNTRVIVVRINDCLAGIVVEDVVALVPAHTGEHTRFSMGNDTMVHMITLGRGESQKSYRVLDFETLAYFSGRSSV